MIAEKRLHRQERNKLKKGAKESGRANKAGHLLPGYSSDRLDDMLLKEGRGCASGGVSVDDDDPHETAKEHCCTAKPSPPPRETTGAVLFEAVEKPGRSVRSALASPQLRPAPRLSSLAAQGSVRLCSRAPSLSPAGHCYQPIFHQTRILGLF